MRSERGEITVVVPLIALTIDASSGAASAIRTDSSITGKMPCGRTLARWVCSSCVVVTVSTGVGTVGVATSPDGSMSVSDDVLAGRNDPARRSSIVATAGSERRDSSP